MVKQKLLNLISRYDIGPKSDNSPNSTKWTIKDGVITVHYLTQNSACRLVVTADNSNVADCEFGIYNPDKLAKMISALDGDIRITYDSKLHTLLLSDPSIEGRFLVSPIDIIFTDSRKDPEFDRPFKEIPTPNVVFNLTRDFCDKFIKSRSALPDATVFAITASNLGSTSKIDFILNYSNHLVNQIRLSVDGQVNSDLDLVAFDLDCVKDILSINRDFDTGTISIFSKIITDSSGGSRVAAGMDLDFVGSGFTSKYRLSKMEII
jgi:hypothetical protein